MVRHGNQKVQSIVFWRYCCCNLGFDISFDQSSSARIWAHESSSISICNCFAFAGLDNDIDPDQVSNCMERCSDALTERFFRCNFVLLLREQWHNAAHCVRIVAHSRDYSCCHASCGDDCIQDSASTLGNAGNSTLFCRRSANRDAIGKCFDIGVWLFFYARSSSFLGGLWIYN